MRASHDEMAKILSILPRSMGKGQPVGFTFESVCQGKDFFSKNELMTPGGFEKAIWELKRLKDWRVRRLSTHIDWEHGLYWRHLTEAWETCPNLDYQEEDIAQMGLYLLQAVRHFLETGNLALGCLEKCIGFFHSTMQKVQTENGKPDALRKYQYFCFRVQEAIKEVLPEPQHDFILRKLEEFRKFSSLSFLPMSIIDINHIVGTFSVHVPAMSFSQERRIEFAILALHLEAQGKPVSDVPQQVVEMIGDVCNVQESELKLKYGFPLRGSAYLQDALPSWYTQMSKMEMHFLRPHIRALAVRRLVMLPAQMKTSQFKGLSGPRNAYHVFYGTIEGGEALLNYDEMRAGAPSFGELKEAYANLKLFAQDPKRQLVLQSLLTPLLWLGEYLSFPDLALHRAVDSAISRLKTEDIAIPLAHLPFRYPTLMSSVKRFVRMGFKPSEESVLSQYMRLSIASLESYPRLARLLKFLRSEVSTNPADLRTACTAASQCINTEVEERKLHTYLQALLTAKVVQFNQACVSGSWVKKKVDDYPLPTVWELSGDKVPGEMRHDMLLGILSVVIGAHLNLLNAENASTYTWTFCKSAKDRTGIQFDLGAVMRGLYHQAPELGFLPTVYDLDGAGRESRISTFKGIVQQVVQVGTSCELAGALGGVMGCAGIRGCSKSVVPAPLALLFAPVFTHVADEHKAIKPKVVIELQAALE